jgi:hypothetical protein
MRTAHFRHGTDEERVQNFGRDNLRKETNLQTSAYTVRDPKDKVGFKDMEQIRVAYVAGEYGR